ncbi:oligosaccharide repeat unit polymerase [Mobilisporobacter senegalensis]|uniref:Oligosaccharide repeat unit polymerase n=1 Tax=Mobilisporobacter senegalensis TaxID=1329262 RepID=A0A3N1XXY7_9FIRM|nr:O-antigen ligase family protein [Mobilisporobacter senegalensis]ROR31483.1 oligosaccharide repeat unit polymerase [Mobilisporobacter senegalensis]
MSKNNRHSKNNSYASSKQMSRNWYLLPIVFIVSILPLIVRMKVYNTGLSGFNWFWNNDTQFDFFLYNKSMVFTIITFIITMLLIWNIISHKFFNSKGINILKENGIYKFTFSLIPLGMYALLALLSTIFSEYSSFGYTGIFEQFESIFVILGYCILVYYVFLITNSEEDIKLIVKYLLVSIMILCVLGLTQATSHDFFASDLGKRLIVPSEHWNILDQLKFNFEDNRVYLTLYNPNYVGLYTSLISPILLVLLLFTKQRKLQILYSIAIAGLILCMIASSSRNGFVALCVSLAFILILFRKLIIKHWKFSIGIISFLIIAFLSINAITGNVFIQRLHSIVTDVKTPEYPLSSILTNDNNIEIIYNNNKLLIQTELNDQNLFDFTLTDENGDEIQTTLDRSSSTYYIDNTRFNTITLQQAHLDSVASFNVIIDGVNWYFTNQLGDNTYYYINNYGRFDKIINAESAIFTDFEKMGSGRGYIWSRTLPLLKNHVLLGSGADTFSLVFPQNDYIGRYHNDYISSLITRPHNMYLQMALQTGVLSLIAFLTFYIMYFISCIRLYFKSNFENYYMQIGAAIFVGTIGYMVSGLFNDSTITVSPIFWLLMGMGMAINYKLKKFK